MQIEINEDLAENEDARISIIGLNEAGYESGNDAMTNGRALPWLQDLESTNVWGAWNVTYRDVILVDEENYVFDTFNLSENDLSEEAVYTDLKDKLMAGLSL
jgi:hypothetical protein